MNQVFNRVLIDEVKNELSADSTSREIVLEQLVRLHWPAVFWEARRSGFTEPEAEDLTQDFFVHIFSDNLTSQCNPLKGSVRTFLLVLFKRFLIDHLRHESAAKRGGRVSVVSMDEVTEELSQNSDNNGVPLCLLDRRWAESVLVQAERKVCAYYAKAGKSEIYDSLKPFLIMDTGKIDYGPVAKELGLSISGLKSALYRMRNRFFIFAVELVEESGRSCSNRRGRHHEPLLPR